MQMSHSGVDNFVISPPPHESARWNNNYCRRLIVPEVSCGQKLLSVRYYKVYCTSLPNLFLAEKDKVDVGKYLNLQGY